MRHYRPNARRISEGNLNSRAAYAISGRKLRKQREINDSAVMLRQARFDRGLQKRNKTLGAREDSKARQGIRLRMLRKSLTIETYEAVDRH